MTGPVQNIIVNQTTTFTLVVTDGCETPPGNGSVTVTTYDVPLVQIAADTTSGCEPVDVVFTNNTDPTLLASAIWDLGNGQTFSGAGTIVSTTYEDPGCYDVFVQITTVDGCLTDTTLSNYICVYEIPVAGFSFEPQDPDMLNSEVQFQNSSQGGTTYSWTFGDGNSSTDFNPTNTYPEIGAQTYPVTLIASTIFGCADTTTQYLTIDEVPLFYAPNALTPNADGMNEGFRPIFITGFTPLGYSFRVFDRWGTLVFETNDLNAEWDGTYLGVRVPDDVYVWQVTFRENQTDITYKEFGHITVLK